MAAKRNLICQRKIEVQRFDRRRFDIDRQMHARVVVKHLDGLAVKARVLQERSREVAVADDTVWCFAACRAALDARREQHGGAACAGVCQQA